MNSEKIALRNENLALKIKIAIMKATMNKPFKMVTIHHNMKVVNYIPDTYLK